MNDRFDAIYRTEHQAVFRHCLALLGNPEDAAEATQEVFSRLVHHLDELDNPAAWVHRVAHNHCVNRLRSRRREVGEPRHQSATADPEHEALARVALTRAFASLTPRERQALAGSTLKDQSVGAVARDLGMTYMGAAKLLSRARRRAAAVAATVVGVATTVLARRTLRAPGTGGGMLSINGQQAAVAVAAALVVGTATGHISGPADRDPVGSSRLPPPAIVTPVPAAPAVAHLSAAPSPTPSASPWGWAQQPSQAAAQTHAAPPPSATSTPRPRSSPSPQPSATPAPMVVGAANYQCNADPSSANVDLSSCSPAPSPTP